MNITVIHGDIVAAESDVIVNAWNRNIIPWWLLLPQGVSGSIKRAGGTGPFKELAKFGPMPLGSARVTGAGRLKFKAIIHVAGINLFWVATEYSVRESVRNAMKIINENRYASASFPLIGSGSGNRGRKWSMDIMLDEFSKISSKCKVQIIQFDKSTRPGDAPSAPVRPEH
jgi:O-acetyl-ADP-ribose deacetylase (regulator of RNase III)